MRRASRRDANEAALVEFFQAHGCEVERINLEGWPDLAVTWFPWSEQGSLPMRSGVALVEVKTAKGKLRQTQECFRQRFPVWVVRSDQDAKKVITWLKS